MNLKKQVIIDGLSVAYSDAGSGPLIVMLHGWGADLSSFDGLALELARQYRLVRVDLPGFGASEQPGVDWRVQDYAEFVRRFLQKIGVDEVRVLLGHSFGGRISIKAVGESLVIPKKLILVDSAGVKESSSMRNNVYKAVAKTGKIITAIPPFSALRGRLRKTLYSSAGSTDYLNAGRMKQIFLNTINEDLLPDAARISVPTLLIWGETDTATPLAQGKLLASRIAGSVLHVIPGAGHYSFIDKPQEVIGQIEEFIG
jgi:pimeloyl-ACP methyl ester carboxylesterase